jgi:hypothetical protein
MPVSMSDAASEGGADAASIEAGNTEAAAAVDAPAPDAACPDRDNDGHRDRACGGDDCNDGDPAIAPGLPARCAAADYNCNGTADHEEGASQDTLDRWCRENVRSADYLTWSHPPRCVRPNGNLTYPYASRPADVRCMACSATPMMPGMYGCACYVDRTGERTCPPGM